MSGKLIYKTKIDVSKYEGLQEFLDTYYPGIEVIDDDVMAQYGDWLLSRRARMEAMFEALDFCELVKTLELKLIGDVERKE